MPRIRVTDHALKSSFPDALWPILSWLVVKVISANPSVLAANITDDVWRSFWREWVWWYFCIDHSRPRGIHHHTIYALSPSWCRKFRKIAKSEIRSYLKSAMSDPETKAGFLEIRRQVLRMRLVATLRSRVETLQGTTSANSPSEEFQEWAHRLGSAYYNPKKAVDYLPPQGMVGPKEAIKLLNDIGAEGYGQVLQSLMWQTIMRPGSLKLAPLRGNHPMWERLGVKPTKETTPGESVDLAFTAALRMLNTLSAWDVVRYWLGRALRQQYGLSRDRNAETGSAREAVAQIHQEQSGRTRRADKADTMDPKAESPFDGVIEQMTMSHLLEKIESLLTPAEFQVLQLKLQSEAHGDFRDLAEANNISYGTARVLLNRIRRKIRPDLLNT